MKKKLFACFVNERPFTAEGEWQQLAPYGIHAHPLGRQKLDKEAAEKMVAALNEAKAKAGNAWRGVPIFIGHPPHRGGDPAQKGKDFPRIGAVMEMEARDDGPYVKVAWNSEGKRNATEGLYVYPSGAWMLAKNGDGTMCPSALDHVGMTNEPNILGVRPWTNESQDSPPKDEPEPEATPMKKEILALLMTALNPHLAANAKLTEESDEEAVCEAVKAVTTTLAANSADITTAQTLAANEKTAREAAENSLKELRKTHADVLLTIAVNEGRITLAQRKDHETAFEADFAQACNALAAITKAARDTKPVALDLKGARVPIATNADRARIIHAAVNELMTTQGMSYEKAHAQVKSDPQYKPVFDAMQQPGQAA